MVVSYANLVDILPTMVVFYACLVAILTTMVVFYACLVALLYNYGGLLCLFGGYFA